MNIEESKNQIETLIEAWQLDEADLNQTDINAMQVLLKENQELKKQVEKRTKMYQNAYDYSQKMEGKAIILETQQKEFINYLEDEIKRINPKNLYIGELNLRLDDIKFTQYLTYKEILQKYKSIIGVSDEKEN